jgi:chromatin segregation and condensation protein Rec8/ScpA/Scc1 (kleisin family)
MPKKTATARGGAQRNRPKVKVQKSFELVRQASDEQELEATKEVESAAFSVSTMAEVKPAKSRVTSETKQDESTAKSRATSAAKQDENASTEISTEPKGSAAARLAARRQAMQKAQQRTAAALITAEHYAYVRKDLIFIAILAAIMFSAIIILHFVPGIGS